ncbi:ras GEF [Hesseltinella vesiculosa]|uniref:Ras GEF n=1 Tax=Hesseltinella vesiculosa TaxID=101127 RepID=A0A1X2GWV7_9FUNG|nr:ras GEF [Hesseltinella vesiculosa]
MSDNPHVAFMHAAQLLDEGLIKDAYVTFLSVVELSAKQLYGVKFVHHTVVSTPDLYEVAISMIRSSLCHLDDIVSKQSIPFQPKKLQPPNTPACKPKPTVPPKPKALPAALPTTLQKIMNVPPSKPTTNRSRGNSVSFAIQETAPNHKGPAVVHIDPNEVNIIGDVEDDDEDDDVDMVVDFHNDTSYPPSSTTRMRRNQSHPNIFRPHTVSDSHVPQITKEAAPRKSLDAYQYQRHHPTSVHPHHPMPASTMTSQHTWSNHTHSHMFRPYAHPMDILADSLVDPSILVPAQTNAGDNLALPLSSSSSPTSDYVPLIPMPPLLSTHRLLQAQLADLENSVNECKTKKRAMLQLPLQDRPPNTHAVEKEWDDLIQQKSSSLSETRETLNRVRTLYMSAATVPSVMQFPPYLVAYQLTLMDAALFRNIPSNALLTHSARHPHPKIVASTDFFNYITRSIEHSILLPLEAARRAEIINRWIKIATKCLLLNNYQTLKAIVAALGTPPVQRLRRTWDCIPKKRMTRLELLNTLMSEVDNYGRYREHMGLLETRTPSTSTSASSPPSATSLSITNFTASSQASLNSISLFSSSSDQARVDAIVSQPASASPTSPKLPHHDKPIIPFLGVFIHDITYLLAAIKQGSRPLDDPRIQGLLATLQAFQMAPPYPSVPPASYIKASQPKKHSFRPSASLITQALQRSAKQKNSSSSSASSSHACGLTAWDDDPQREMELEQQLITQYLLMRPWVNERIVDELSTLREPPKPRSGSSPGPRYNNSANNLHSQQTSSSSYSYTSSIFSSASSIVRFQSTTSSITSWDEDDELHDRQSSVVVCDDDDDEEELPMDTMLFKSNPQEYLQLYPHSSNRQNKIDGLEIAKTSAFPGPLLVSLQPSTSASMIHSSPNSAVEPTPRNSSTFRSLRTMHSFTRPSTSTSSSTSTSNSNVAPPPPPHPKDTSTSAFSIVGHLRSLSLPTSDHPVVFRKKA